MNGSTHSQNSITVMIAGLNLNITKRMFSLYTHYIKHYTAQLLLYAYKVYYKMYYVLFTISLNNKC